MKKEFIIFIILLYVTSIGYAQKFNFKNLGSKQGLSSLEIIDLIQDDKGFIWFTTLNGVAKYNGRKVRVVKKSDGLSGNFTRRLFLDSEKRLWVSTYGQGINYFKNDSLYSFSKDSLFKWSGAGNITEGKDGDIWIAGLNDLILFRDNQFIDYDSIHHMTNIRDVIYRNDTLWIASIKSGLFAYDLKTKTYVNYNLDDGLKNNICYSVFIDSKNQLWAGCYGGLSLIKNDTILSYEISPDFNKNRVHKIIEDKEGYLWLALYGNGMAKWDKNKKETVQIFTNKNGLSHPYVNSIFIDNNNNIWLATDGMGVYLLNDLSIQRFDTDYGFSSNKINDFNIKNDHIQILTVDGGEILMYKDTVIINKITFHNNELVSINTSIELNDTTWYGTSSGLRFKIKNNKTYESVNNIEPVSSNSFASILFRNRPFFSGVRECVYSVNGKNLIIFDTKDHKQNISPLALGIDVNHNLWTANFNSIAYLNLNDSTLYSFLPSKQLNHYYTDCFGYKDAIYFIGEDYFESITYNGNDTIFTQYDVLRNIGVEMSHGIFIDNDTVYIGHTRGLTYFNINDINKKNIAYHTLSKEDGLPDEGVQVIKKYKNNVFWMSSYEGLYKYDKSIENRNDSPPKVYLQSVELFSEPISIPEFHQLSYNQNHLTFKWSTIAFNHIDRIEFSYQLKGYDEDWSKPTKDLYTVYKKLPPGTYEFNIKSRYHTGQWSEPVTMAAFYIDAPFWQKWWFILIILILISGILANLIYSVIITKKQKVTLQQFSKELINSQEEERSKISKDLHDSVGQLLLFVRNKLRTEKADDEIVNELDSALDEVRQISRQLHPYQLEKFGLTKAVELLVEKASQNSNVFFSEEVDQINNVLPKNYELIIYRIIQETINNIIKHSQAKSAKIEIEKQEKQIKLVIKDNGKGFNAKEILSGKKHAFGLTGIIERVKIIKGGITIESSEKGTTIKIYIPL